MADLNTNIIKDKDLLFLSLCTSEELNDLVKTLTQDEKGVNRTTELLTANEHFKKNFPNHKEYVNLIASEFLDFGSNSFFAFVGEQKSYREVLKNVCKKLKVKIDPKSEVSIIEYKFMQSLIISTIEKLNENSKEFKEFVNQLKLDSAKVNKKELIKYILINTATGRGISFVLPIVIIEAFIKAAIWVITGSTFSSAVSTTVLGSAFGPIGMIAGGAYTIFDIAGPAYRVIIPATLQIAYLRNKQMQNSDFLQQNEIDFLNGFDDEFKSIYTRLKFNVKIELLHIGCNSFHVNKGKTKLAFKTKQIKHLLAISKNTDNNILKIEFPVTKFTSIEINNTTDYIEKEKRIIKETIKSYNYQLKGACLPCL